MSAASSCAAIARPPKSRGGEYLVLVNFALLGSLLAAAILIPLSQSTPQASLPATWMTQVAALSGQAPKLNVAPLIQLDTSSRYYKTMIDGMVHNFKKAVAKASERSFSLNNSTSSRPIAFVSSASSPASGGSGQQKISVQDIQIEGLSKPKVSNVLLNSKNLKLHVVFTYKTIKVTGRCVSMAQKGAGGSGAPAARLLLEATNWNTSWSANLLNMVGREHFDMNRVYTSDSQQRLNFNLKEVPPGLHEKLKAALLERVRGQIEARLVEVMESVMMQTEPSSSEETLSHLPASSQPKERGKRASGAIGAASKQASSTPSKKKSSGAGQAKASATKQHGRKKEERKSMKKENPILGANKMSGSQARETGDKGKASSKQDRPSKGRRLSTRRGGNSTVGEADEFTSANFKQSQRVLKRTKRQTPCSQGEELDDYVDQLFRFGTRIVRAMEPITTPNATIELPDYNLKIFLYDGKGTRAYKFRRAKPAWVFCSNETISLGLTIEVEELRVAYKYRVISGNRLLFDGDLEAKLSPRIQAQFSQKVQEEDSEEPVQQRVDRIRLFRLGRVHVIIRGLGNLTQSLSMLINSYLNDNQEELQPTFRMVEGDAVRLVNRMLATVNVPLLSVV